MRRVSAEGQIQVSPGQSVPKAEVSVRMRLTVDELAIVLADHLAAVAMCRVRPCCCPGHYLPAPCRRLAVHSEGERHLQVARLMAVKLGDCRNADLASVVKVLLTAPEALEWMTAVTVLVTGRRLDECCWPSIRLLRLR